MQVVESKGTRRVPRRGREQKAVKCVAWDLDNTLWDGVLLEDENVTLRDGVREIVETLDGRGILQSVASKNDPERATAKLREFGLNDYFLYPQISWNSKASSIRNIAAALNIGLDAVAFIDDQPFERDEVNFSLKEVLCIDAVELCGLLKRPELIPRFITAVLPVHYSTSGSSATKLTRHEKHLAQSLLLFERAAGTERDAG